MQQADIRMRSHGLLRLDDNKSVTVQVAVSLQISSCSKSNVHRLDAIDEVNRLDTLVGKLHQAGRIHNLHQVCGFLAVYIIGTN